MLFLKRILGNLARLLRGEWATLNLKDKLELGGTVCGPLLGMLGLTYAASTELDVLLDIQRRMSPAVEQYDTVYVSKAKRDGEVVAIDLKKVRTEHPMEYQVWMCGGTQNREMIFFGEGHLGREEAENTFRVAIDETPSSILLKVASEGREYVRHEEWDLNRSIKESETTVVEGNANCGEV